MADSVDGFSLRLSKRDNAKAERRQQGRLLDTIPVAWTAGRTVDGATKAVFVKVWYQDADERAAVVASASPIAVAMATAKDDASDIPQLEEFRAVFEVLPTGWIFDDNQLEAKILRRLRAQ